MMAITIDQINGGEAHNLILEQLRIDAKHQDSSSIYAELVRCGLWANSQLNEVGAPVLIHRQRIVSFGVTTARILDLGDTGMLSKTLDELEAIGEAVRFPNGYFLPAPMRWVRDGGGQRDLLIGGMPTHALPRPVHSNLSHHHLVRIGKSVSADLFPVQSLSDWIDKPSDPLEEWAAQVYERYAHQSTFNSIDQLRNLHVDVYPFRSGRDFQYDRWTDRIDELAKQPGQYLARSRNQYGRVIRYLIWVAKARIRLVEIDASEIDVRRLQYALDSMYAQPTLAVLEIGSTTTSLLLSNELPRAEQKLLTAIAKRVTSDTGKYYLRKWIIDNLDLQRMRGALGDLRIQIEEQHS